MTEFDNRDNIINFDDFKAMIQKIYNDKNIKESTKEAFELLDVNKDGILSRQLLKEYLMNNGEVKLNTKEVEDLFDDINFDEKGNFDYKKFIVETFDIFE